MTQLLSYTCRCPAILECLLAGAIAAMTKPTVYVDDDQSAVCHGLRELLREPLI
jgi:hypothetical protein